MYVHDAFGILYIMCLFFVLFHAYVSVGNFMFFLWLMTFTNLSFGLRLTVIGGFSVFFWVGYLLRIMVVLLLVVYQYTTNLIQSRVPKEF